MKVPMVLYVTADGPTPAIVLKENENGSLNLHVIHQSGRTEKIERVKECLNPTREMWMPYPKEAEREANV